MPSTNCWEFKKCGREPGGSRVREMGPCPAATCAPADGFLGGSQGGRACAYLTGTFCSGVVEGTYRIKEKQCQECDFYRHLRASHGADCSVLAFSKHVQRSGTNHPALPDLENLKAG
ncbi:MAG: hypothetical protein HY904_22255 [Deltaproteobacteria bacterium]|nr:hypothetical protein [Deltaproteobacteria bacterium]